MPNLDALNSPVTYIETDQPASQPENGIALCLSGGGYRAMLFHTGTLLRLNELGYFQRIDRISSVSGGSIVAGVLGMRWNELVFENGVAKNFPELVMQPILNLADHTVDISSVVIGTFAPGTISEHLVSAYKKHLFQNASLQGLPDRPRFVFNAANVQSKVLWRFMKPYMRDYRVGEIKNPNIELATVVTACSAFPPVLSPVILHFSEDSYTPNSGLDLQRSPFTTDVVLTDGGVYDNLGLETAWKRYATVLVSDGGGMYMPEPNPKNDWIHHSKRILDLIDNQVRSLRKRQLIESFKSGARKGAYWGIWSDIAEYNGARKLSCHSAITRTLASIPTRFKALETKDQQMLVNWGYAICDAAMRRYVDSNTSVPANFPYPAFSLNGRL